MQKKTFAFKMIHVCEEVILLLHIFVISCAMYTYTDVKVEGMLRKFFHFISRFCNRVILVLMKENLKAGFYCITYDV